MLCMMSDEGVWQMGLMGKVEGSIFLGHHGVVCDIKGLRTTTGPGV